MERHTAMRIRKRTNDRHSCRLIERLVTENQRRASPALLMTGLRIKGQCDKIAFGQECKPPLPRFLADRRPEAFFDRLVIGGHPRNHLG